MVRLSKDEVVTIAHCCGFAEEMDLAIFEIQVPKRYKGARLQYCVQEQCREQAHDFFQGTCKVIAELSQLFWDP